jgi:uncharacterized protein (TIGR02588 family)
VKRPGQARKLAEWVTLSISALIILTLAGFLLWEARQGHEPLQVVTVQPGWMEVREIQGQFILPVTVTNLGRRTLRDLRIDLAYQLRDKDEEKTDLLIDQLDKHGCETVYFYFDQAPSQLGVKVRATSYRLD